ncbi:hypothetical protein GCM10023168_24470 [Fodinibacter luteus]|uniref:Gram-positive cocci surface proteins LPxTG domain-containing protein n=1 Tax=Fodinibacter luteus TaxID=552064 RepID=A0ABP8KJD9_9MICO
MHLLTVARRPAALPAGGHRARRGAGRRLHRLAGAAAASGLALAGLVVAAAPASAAACSGTSGVTVVVDTGGSKSTRCASGDPSSALKALTAAGFSVTYPQQYPGSVVCRIDGYPESDPCVRMPPADAYWAFFHAKRGGSWVYGSSGVASYDPAPGTVVGFRFGSGQQPRVAPPEPPATSQPAPTTTTPKATSTTKKTTPKPATAAPRTTSGSTSGSTSGTTSTTPNGSAPGATGSPTAGPSASPWASGTASASPSTTASASATGTAPASEPSTVAAAPTSQPSDDAAGPGTLLAGAALVALVAGGAGYAAWKRRA